MTDSEHPLAGAIESSDISIPPSYSLFLSLSAKPEMQTSANQVRKICSHKDAFILEAELRLTFGGPHAGKGSAIAVLTETSVKEKLGPQKPNRRAIQIRRLCCRAACRWLTT